MLRNLFCLTALAAWFSVGAAGIVKGENMLKEGDAAPEFTVLDDLGNEWKSAEHYGKQVVVVYFYPADMTGGCTKHACGFRDA